MFVALPMPRWYLFVADPTAAAAALRGENCNTKKKKEEKEKEKEIVSNMNYDRYITMCSIVVLIYFWTHLLRR